MPFNGHQKGDFIQVGSYKELDEEILNEWGKKPWYDLDDEIELADI